MRRATALAATGVALHGAPAAAQTRFEMPDTTTLDVGTYTTIEECVAATERVRRGTARRERVRVWDDTLPWNPTAVLAPLPEAVVATARRCSARFPAATVPLSDFSVALPLYLTANRDADVTALTRRRLRAIESPRRERAGAPTGGSAEAQRIAVLDSVFNAYMRATPYRLAAADSLVKALDRSLPRPLRADPALDLMQMYMQIGTKDLEVADSAGMRAVGARVVVIMDSLTAAERELVKEKLDAGGSSSYVGLVFSANLMSAGFGVMLDSLRRSTAAYLAFLHAQLPQAVELSGFPFGKRAPRLTGTYVADDSAARGPRPVPGKVNLIVFLHGQCTDVLPQVLSYDLNWQSDCMPVASLLRRTAARYPALEITVVDRTRGYFAYEPPPAPDSEAALIGESIRSHGLPGTLMVATTDFSRLAPPDRRRLEKPYLPDFTPYSFGPGNVTDLGASFLVDKDGIIVYSGIDREREEFIDAMIGILIGRENAERTPAPTGSPGAGR